MDSREIIKRLRKDGWEHVRTKGDHWTFKNPGSARIITVPHPKKDLPIGLVRDIFRSAGWDWKGR